MSKSRGKIALIKKLKIIQKLRIFDKTFKNFIKKFKKNLLLLSPYQKKSTFLLFDGMQKIINSIIRPILPSTPRYFVSHSTRVDRPTSDSIDDLRQFFRRNEPRKVVIATRYNSQYPFAPKLRDEPARSRLAQCRHEETSARFYCLRAAIH